MTNRVEAEGMGDGKGGGDGGGDGDDGGKDRPGSIVAPRVDSFAVVEDDLWFMQ